MVRRVVGAERFGVLSGRMHVNQEKTRSKHMGGVCNGGLSPPAAPLAGGNEQNEHIEHRLLPPPTH